MTIRILAFLVLVLWFAGMVFAYVADHTIPLFAVPLVGLVLGFTIVAAPIALACLFVYLIAVILGVVEV